MVSGPDEELRRALDNSYEELQAALAARTYDDGVRDGAFTELAHLHMYLTAVTRALAEAVGEVETRMERLRGKP